MSNEINTDIDNIRADTSESVDNNETDSPILNKPKDRKKTNKFRAPILIAFMLLLLSIIFFVIWTLFFNKAINGTWKYSIVINDENTKTEYNYALSFEDNGVCRYTLGGTTYTGKYRSKYENGKHKLNLVFTMVGTEVYNNNLTYDVSGNIFTGRQLYLTDIDGMILPPDDMSNGEETSLEFKSKLANSKEEKGTRYYILPFEAIDNVTPQIKKFENFKTDEKLTGIWYEANELSGYGYTFTFNSDGTYEINYSDVSYSGGYSAENGNCDYNLISLDGTESKESFKYSFDGEDLVIEIGNNKSTLVRSNDKYAFKTKIQ